MKKCLLLLSMMLFAFCFQSKAQNWTDLQHEVSLSYGGLPVADLLHHYENYFDPSTESVNLYDDKGKFGALNISYIFYPDEDWGIGLVYSYTNSDKRILADQKIVSCPGDEILRLVHVETVAFDARLGAERERVVVVVEIGRASCRERV